MEVLHTNGAGTKHQISESKREFFMSGFSRGPEIRRRRKRKEQITKLNKRLASASSDADRTRLTAKLHRLGLMSPGTPLVK
jgi:hypothetical protein